MKIILNEYRSNSAPPLGMDDSAPPWLRARSWKVASTILRNQSRRGMRYKPRRKISAYIKAALAS